MKIAIVGLPNCGKTTTFNALTGGAAETAGYSGGRLRPNLATVKVPDPRLERLAEIYNPKKVTAAEVQYIDVGGFGQSESGGELPPELLNYIGSADALLHVVRCFKDPAVPHPRDSVDAARDWNELEMELILSDLAIAERRVEKLGKEISKLPAAEKAKRQREFDLLQRVRSHLEEEKPLRVLELTREEEKTLRGYAFLTAKPQLTVFNLDESSLANPPSLEHAGPSVGFCAQVEAELAQLEPEDAAEFMEDLGIAESARDQVLTQSYALLGLVSFLTVGSDEVRAWTIKLGASAEEAGGTIHSDIQRGFIRAEVVTYADLVEAGGLSEARRNGKLRAEGKSYRVQDGDVCNFLFNV